MPLFLVELVMLVLVGILAQNEIKVSQVEKSDKGIFQSRKMFVAFQQLFETGPKKAEKG